MGYGEEPEMNGYLTEQMAKEHLADLSRASRAAAAAKVAQRELGELPSVRDHLGAQLIRLGTKLGGSIAPPRASAH